LIAVGLVWHAVARRLSARGSPIPED
jgi:hypothetical protein